MKKRTATVPRATLRFAAMVVLLCGACTAPNPTSPPVPTSIPTAVATASATATTAPTPVPTAVPPTAVPSATPVSRNVQIAWVMGPEARIPSDQVELLQTSITKLLADRSITVKWNVLASDAEPLRSLQSNPRSFDIVILAEGRPPAEVSTILRQWLEQGGIVWAFENGQQSTWRNKELFDGVLPGADKEWEPPEQIQVMAAGLTVLPYDAKHAVANGVSKEIFLGGYHTVIGDAKTNQLFCFLTRFERALDKTAVPLLKVQKVGEAVLGEQTPNPTEWVVVGFAKTVGKGQTVILPFLDPSDASAQRFLANLIAWNLLPNDR